jgi:MFS transporter, PHS family, inorganic phosphate transporter
VFPTRYRSTAHGISAACGKLGAILAQVVFSPLKDKGGVVNGWVDHLMQIFALFMLLGFFLSWLIPETKGKTLEELSGEDEEEGVHRQPEVHQPLERRNEVEEESTRNTESDRSRPSLSLDGLIG